MAEEEEVHRLRIAIDVIYRGPAMSPSAADNGVREFAGFVQVLGFKDVKNIEVVYQPPEDRVIYAHHHNSPDGEYCRVARRGCLVQASDGLNQQNIEL